MDVSQINRWGQGFLNNLKAMWQRGLGRPSHVRCGGRCVEHDRTALLDSLVQRSTIRVPVIAGSADDRTPARGERP
jgi:hypothetical protein